MLGGKKGCKFLAISFLLHVLPRSPSGDAELAIWTFFAFSSPSSPPSTYVHTDMVYSLYLNNIITLNFYQTSGQGKQERRLDVSLGVAKSCCLIRELRK